MTVFQWVTLPLIGVAAGRTCYRILRKDRSRISYWVALAVWVAGAVAIGRPELTSRIAAALGIGRGADLVFYGFCLTFLATSLAVYNRFQRLESALTLLVRDRALRDAYARWPEATAGNTQRGNAP